MDKVVSITGELGDTGLFKHAPGTEYLHLLREVLLTYRQVLRRLASETGLSGAQVEVLRELALADGRSTVSALARELGADRAAISRLIAGLERDGLVARTRDERDKRRQPIVLTGEGRRLAVALHMQCRTPRNSPPLAPTNSPPAIVCQF